MVGAPVDDDRQPGPVQLGQPALEAAEKTRRYLDAALNRSVERRRQEILPAGIGEPIVAYPGASDALVARLEQLQSRLQRRSRTSRRATGAAGTADHRRCGRVWAAERPRLDTGLEGHHPEVQEFLRQAATEEGAPWRFITPVVGGWLDDPENTANLRVVLRS